MRLELIEYWDRDTGWNLEKTELAPDLTLLVGISGAGKSRALYAISHLRQIGMGSHTQETPCWGIEWNASFRSSAGKCIQWSGEFSKRDPKSIVSKDKFSFWDEDDDDQDEDFSKPKILRELILINDQVIIDRNENRILLNGTSTPKVSPFLSALRLFSREDKLKEFARGLRNLVNIDTGTENREQYVPASIFNSVLKQSKSLDALRSTPAPTLIKLMVMCSKFPHTRRQIEERMRQAFPMIENIGVCIEKRWNNEFAALEFKEQNVKAPIPQRSMSSGIIRTLMHLARLELWPKGSIVLVDEFENSLGINCIDFVTENMKEKSNDIQFIITSHHPYIINSISSKHWKIVGRKGGRIRTTNPDILGLQTGPNSSHHDLFLKLINLDAFREGAL